MLKVPLGVSGLEWLGWVLLVLVQRAAAGTAVVGYHHKLGSFCVSRTGRKTSRLRFKQ